MPKIIKILNKGLITGLIAGALSFFIKIVPCTRSAVIAKPEYKFGFCKLPNPFAEPLLGISQKFYGAFTEPLAGLILQVLIITIIITLVLTFFKKKNRKIVDLTKK